MVSLACAHLLLMRLSPKVLVAKAAAAVIIRQGHPRCQQTVLQESSKFCLDPSIAGQNSRKPFGNIDLGYELGILDGRPARIF